MIGYFGGDVVNVLSKSFSITTLQYGTCIVSLFWKRWIRLAEAIISVLPSYNIDF